MTKKKERRVELFTDTGGDLCIKLYWNGTGMQCRLTDEEIDYLRDGLEANR